MEENVSTYHWRCKDTTNFSFQLFFHEKIKKIMLFAILLATLLRAV